MKSGFEDALGVAELEVVDRRDDAEVTEEVDGVFIEDDDELEEEDTVPLRTYNESRLPAPQNSELLPAQLMLQLLSGSRTLVLPRTFPQ